MTPAEQVAIIREIRAENARLRAALMQCAAVLGDYVDNDEVPEMCAMAEARAEADAALAEVVA